MEAATARAWELKEAFGHFWKYKSVLWASGFLDAWCERAMRSRLEPMKKMARVLPVPVESKFQVINQAVSVPASAWVKSWDFGLLPDICQSVLRFVRSTHLAYGVRHGLGYVRKIRFSPQLLRSYRPVRRLLLLLSGCDQASLRDRQP